jgi:hypothetical protein
MGSPAKNLNVGLDRNGRADRAPRTAAAAAGAHYARYAPGWHRCFGGKIGLLPSDGAACPLIPRSGACLSSPQITFILKRIFVAAGLPMPHLF